MDVDGRGGDGEGEEDEEGESVDEDEDERGDAGEDGDESEEDVDIDVEGEGDSGGDDDFMEGCYVLDIDIDGIEGSIWVRAEYIRIFNHIAELHNKLVSSIRRDKKSYCVILTGQPGIGEFNLAEVIRLSPLKPCAHRKKQVSPIRHAEMLCRKPTIRFIHRGNPLFVC
jgi:hypothetical protein